MNEYTEIYLLQVPSFFFFWTEFPHLYTKLDNTPRIPRQNLAVCDLECSGQACASSRTVVQERQSPQVGEGCVRRVARGSCPVDCCAGRGVQWLSWMDGARPR